jgi:hypothetical protein
MSTKHKLADGVFQYDFSDIYVPEVQAATDDTAPNVGETADDDWLTGHLTELDASAVTRIALKDRVLRLSQTRDLTPAEPLIGNLLYRNTLAQYSAERGSYKSFVAVGLACAVAAGKGWGQHQVPNRGRVVYVAAEGVSGIGLRVRGWCAQFGVDPEDLEDWLFILPEPFQLGDQLVDVTEAVELVREFDADLLILDTRHRCTVGLEENSATDQGVAIDSAERIRRAADCTVLVVHHTGANGNQRGSTAWPGAVWSELSSTRTGHVEDNGGKPMGVTITVDKHKDAEIPGPVSFDLLRQTVPEDWAPNLVERDRMTLVAVPAEEPHQLVNLRAAIKVDTNTADVALLRLWTSQGDPPKSREDVRARSKDSTGKGWGANRAGRALKAWQSEQ